jgi:hypothetical protein
MHYSFLTFLGKIMVQKIHYLIKYVTYFKCVNYVIYLTSYITLTDPKGLTFDL